jgi:hypothetical protein
MPPTRIPPPGPTQPAPRVGEYTNMSSAPPSVYTGYPTLATFPAHPYPATFSPQQYPRPLLLPPPSPAMYPQDMPGVGPHSFPHFFPGHRWSTPSLGVPHHYGAYGAQHPSVHQPAQYSHPAHPFHAPREPPSAWPIISPSVGAPVLSEGSSHRERRTGGAHGKVRECDYNKDRDKAKDEDKDIDRAQPLERRPYHPTPPASRSDWVMWVGNVPRDAGHDEMWRFFTEGHRSLRLRVRQLFVVCGPLGRHCAVRWRAA